LGEEEEKKMGAKFLGAAAAALLISITAVPGAFAQDGSDPSMAGAASAPAGAQPQVTQPDEGGVNWKGVGIGAGTVASNVVYIPVKLLYGILGGIGGGAGYLLTGGNQQVSDTIWRSSLGGDYIVTPDMITGKEPVHFSGPTETAPPPAPDADSGVAPLPPITSNAAPSSSALSSASIAPANAAPIRPMDSGTGPIREGGSTISGGASVGAGDAADGSGMAPAGKGDQFPATNIE
jgi:hypothetical protein